MKVFILDNHDSKSVMHGEDVLRSIGCELAAMSVGDDLTIECVEMTEEEIAVLPEI